MENKKKLTEVIKQKVISAALIITANMMGTGAAYSTDAFSKAEGAVTSLQDKIINFASIIFPFSLVILVVAILFTHDQKALQTELKTGLMICVAYAVLLLIKSGAVKSTIEGLGL